MVNPRSDHNREVDRAVARKREAERDGEKERGRERLVINRERWERKRDGETSVKERDG